MSLRGKWSNFFSGNKIVDGLWPFSKRPFNKQLWSEDQLILFKRSKVTSRQPEKVIRQFGRLKQSWPKKKKLFSPLLEVTTLPFCPLLESTQTNKNWRNSQTNNQTNKQSNSQTNNRTNKQTMQTQKSNQKKTLKINLDSIDLTKKNCNCYCNCKVVNTK